MASPTETRFDAGGLRMRALVAGDPSKPAVVLLHGFPELSESWRDVLPALADAGLYAVAPDLRGYGGTDKPRTGYDLDSLAGDVAALIDALGRGKAHVVGHDWGGAIAYHLAAHRPEKVDRLAVVNCPHPSVFARRLWWPRQLARSWYMFFFQLPLLPERALTAEHAALVPRMLRASAVDKANFTPARLAPYAENFQRPGVARAALAYYRTALRGALRPGVLLRFGRYPLIRAPFMLVWAEDDVALGKELTVGIDRWFSAPPDVRYLPKVGHFAPIEAPEKVAALLVEHLTR